MSATMNNSASRYNLSLNSYNDNVSIPMQDLSNSQLGSQIERISNSSISLFEETEVQLNMDAQPSLEEGNLRFVHQDRIDDSHVDQHQQELLLETVSIGSDITVYENEIDPFEMMEQGNVDHSEESRQTLEHEINAIRHQNDSWAYKHRHKIMAGIGAGLGATAVIGGVAGYFSSSAKIEKIKDTTTEKIPTRPNRFSTLKPMIETPSPRDDLAVRHCLEHRAYDCTVAYDYIEESPTAKYCKGQTFYIRAQGSSEYHVLSQREQTTKPLTEGNTDLCARSILAGTRSDHIVHQVKGTITSEKLNPISRNKQHCTFTDSQGRTHKLYDQFGSPMVRMKSGDRESEFCRVPLMHTSKCNSPRGDFTKIMHANNHFPQGYRFHCDGDKHMDREIPSNKLVKAFVVDENGGSNWCYKVDMDTDKGNWYGISPYWYGNVAGQGAWCKVLAPGESASRIKVTRWAGIGNMDSGVRSYNTPGDVNFALLSRDPNKKAETIKTYYDTSPIKTVGQYKVQSEKFIQQVRSIGEKTIADSLAADQSMKELRDGTFS